jgi:hypothetical protein
LPNRNGDEHQQENTASDDISDVDRPTRTPLGSDTQQKIREHAQ